MASGLLGNGHPKWESIETTSLGIVQEDVLALLSPICDRKGFGASALGIVKSWFLPYDFNL
jgi:hypothetical protein